MQAITEAATERIGPLDSQTVDGELIDPDLAEQALNEERSIGVYRTSTFSTAEAILDGRERFLDARS